MVRAADCGVARRVTRLTYMSHIPGVLEGVEAACLLHMARRSGALCAGAKCLDAAWKLPGGACRGVTR